MIRSNDKGQIVVEANGESYNLSVSEEYSSFLLWITTPNSDITIDEKTFQVADDSAESERDKAKRYAEFLTDFAKRRKKRLDELDQLLPSKEREDRVNAFIGRLNQKGN